MSDHYNMIALLSLDAYGRTPSRPPSKPASACSIYFNVSRTRQDNLPIFIHEATVLWSIPNHSGLH